MIIRLIKKHFILTVFSASFTWTADAQYFQQEVNYKITVTLNDIEHSLSAFETFEYINHSPDTLFEIYIHLWANAYKNKNTALSRQWYENGNTESWFAADKDRGYIDGLHFKVDNSDVKFLYDSAQIDIGRIILNEPLYPGRHITVSTPFYVKLPSARLSRMGHLGQFYAITQWYPKPAVYDEHGWHPMPYLDMGEFYSEFGTYDVSITLPKNYIVGATGELQDEEEVRFLNERVSQTESIVDFGKSMEFPTSDPEDKTIRYVQSNVHDFAWFADKRFHVLKGSVEMPVSKRKVITWAFFTNDEAGLWKNSISYINKALLNYSTWIGEYEYNNCSAVDGTISAGVGMEYPCITVIGESRFDFVLEEVIVHEVGHNWFYGMLASNERDYAWLDEGINTFYEMRHMSEAAVNKGRVKSAIGETGWAGRLTGLADIDSRDLSFLAYLYVARRNSDQPINTPAPEFTETNYGAVLYAKTGLGFEYLRAYLGTGLFDSCMQEYFRMYKFKHPYPADLKKVFTETSGKNLDWFFNDFINTDAKPDYSIRSLQRIYGNSLINPASKGYALKIKNKGSLNGPFSASAIQNGRVLSTQWYEGFKRIDTMFISCEQCDHIKIDVHESIPDINRKNNSFRTRGILKGVEKISFPFLIRTENPERTQVTWTPIAGWNNYNKLMAGLALHNISFIRKRFEYVVAPMYSLGTERFAGMATLKYSAFPGTGIFRRVTVTGQLSRFAYNVSEAKPLIRPKYSRLEGELNFLIKNSKHKSPWVSAVSFRNINIMEQMTGYGPEPEFEPLITGETGRYHNIISLTMKNRRAIDPFSGGVEIEQGKNYVKPSLELVYRYSYKRKNRGIDFRFFTQGFFLNIGSVNSVHMTGTGKGFGGSEDYLYDNSYFGRSDYTGFWSRQFYHQAGDFKIYSPIGRNDLWISTVNIKAHLPGRLPVKAYLDIGLYDKSRRSYMDYKGLTYDAGICLYLVQDIMEVYFPLVHSTDIRRYLETNDLRFRDKIRFVFNINALSPFRLRDGILTF